MTSKQLPSTPASPELRFMRMHPDVQTPFRATSESVGADLHAFLLTETGRPNTALIPPKTTRAIPTGLIVQPPRGYAVFVCSRSGLAKEASVFVTNAPGVIDPDYRGEILVLLYNGGHTSFYVKHGDRVGQLVLLHAPTFQLREHPIDLQTPRGAAGFGSTGR